MHKNRLTTFLGIALMCIGLSQSAWGFSPSKYATTSKLASGKWVKIKVAENGVYQLTNQELSDMGFSNPASVRVYGSGGNAISEVLDGNAPDDLQPVAVKRYSDKICFYAKGPVGFTLTDPRSTKPHYTRTINTYTQYGYYFLTEGGSDTEPTIEQVEASTTGTVARSGSYDYFYHENDLMSAGFTGRDMLGERITDSENTFDYYLPGLVQGSDICVNPCVAANINKPSSATSVVGYVQSYLNSGGETDTVNFQTSPSAIRYYESTLVFYNSASPSALVAPKVYSETGNVKITFNIPSDLELKWARLDWLILTYLHNNTSQSNQNGQFRMGIAKQTESDLIELPGADANTVVWNIDNTSKPVEYKLADYTDENVGACRVFTPGTASNWSQYVAFNPTDTLKTIAGFENVANQNLHALSTPDMVIVTNKAFMEQAERVAQMHRDNDGMTVHVVDQEQVYNEFSSGTPDAMAIRLMNKMFFDRDQSKFKYLLMFGCGSFDNRGIISNKKNRVITYESESTNDENTSYCADDFFGVLADNSGYNICSEPLKIGVGRITCVDESEAKSDVDKLLNYVNNPDYGVWRNHVLLSSDTGDSDKHLFQAVGIENIITDDLATNLMPAKAYVELFPTASETKEPGVVAERRSASEAKRYISQSLKSGQYFWTYVGHAGPHNYTKFGHMWTSTEAQSATYDRLPIMTTACCDVARYDSDTRGIAEIQFHKKDGGAIALFTSPRSVFSDNNDKLNRAWTNAMFSFMNTGTMPRIGDVYLQAKQAFGTTSVEDKVKFFMLGDPAMAINYPKPYFKIQSINGSAVNDSTAYNIRALQDMKIVANVMNADGTSVNTAFNGDATIVLYDTQGALVKQVKGTVNSKTVTRDVYAARPELAQVTGRVVNGVFTGTITVPRYEQATWEKGVVSLYAHQDGTAEMVNGKYSGLQINPYIESVAVSDTEAPVIESMFFNDETTFAEGAIVPSTSTLYITATDNHAISTKSVGLSGGMTLVLDGGQSSYNEITSYAVVTNDGKNLSISLPMNGLESGQHTLTYTVCDAAGNVAQRTISFIVGPASQVTLTAEETPAIDKVTFNMDSELAENPTVTVKVTDATGKVVYSKKTSSFPFVWNLKDNDGKQVAPGLYRYFGTYENSTEYGGTDINKLIVIGAYKSNK